MGVSGEVFLYCTYVQLHIERGVVGLLFSSTKRVFDFQTMLGSRVVLWIVMLIIKVGPNTFTREVVMNLMAFYLSIFNISIVSTTENKQQQQQNIIQQEQGCGSGSAITFPPGQWTGSGSFNSRSKFGLKLLKIQNLISYSEKS